MRLYLMRHGIATPRDDPDCPPDPERPLTQKGIKFTRAAARGLHNLGVFPNAILSSPYLRAIQTGEIAADEFGLPRKNIVRTDALRPEAEPKNLLAELALFPDDEVLCTGHLPNLDLVVAEVLGQPGVTVTSLKKAGVACLDVYGFNQPEGMLRWLATSRLLRSVSSKL